MVSSTHPDKAPGSWLRGAHRPRGSRPCSCRHTMCSAGVPAESCKGTGSSLHNWTFVSHGCSARPSSAGAARVCHAGHATQLEFFLPRHFRLSASILVLGLCIIDKTLRFASLLLLIFTKRLALAIAEHHPVGHPAWRPRPAWCWRHAGRNVNPPPDCSCTPLPPRSPVVPLRTTSLVCAPNSLDFDTIRFTSSSSSSSFTLTL